MTKIFYTKKTLHANGKKREDAIEKRRKWQENQPTLQATKLVFLDESSINLAYTHLYGHAKSNQRIHEGIKDVRFKRQSIVSTVRLSGEK